MPPQRRRPSNLSGIVGQGKVAEGSRPQFRKREASVDSPASPAPSPPPAPSPSPSPDSWWRRRWLLAPVGLLVAGAIAVPFWLAVEKAPAATSSPAGMPLSGGGGPDVPVPVSAAPQPAIGSPSTTPVSAAPSRSASASPTPSRSPSERPATGKAAARPKATGKPGTGADLALNRPVTRSGAEAGHFEATMAVDGDDTTRWGSAWQDGEWIAVDLGAVWSIRSVEVLWEHAHPSQYRIDLSTDGKSWKAAKSGIPGREGLITTSIGPAPARWVRLSTTRRPGSQYGVSLWSLHVR